MPENELLETLDYGRLRALSNLAGLLVAGPPAADRHGCDVLGKKVAVMPLEGGYRRL